MSTSIYYIYAYFREDDTPYYVGKGKNRRAYSKNHNINLPKDKSKIIFLHEDLTEEDAFAKEKELIKHYGRKDLGTGILRNLTDGGEGVSGVIISEEDRKKRSVAGKGRQVSEETRKKISEANTGAKHHMFNKTMSENQRKKISDSQSGEKHYMYGKQHSEETKRKLAAASCGNKNCVGRIISEESRRKMSVARKTYLAAKKKL